MSTFFAAEAIAVGITATQISQSGVVYSTPSGKNDIIISFLLSNIVSSTISVDITITRSSNTIYLGKSITIPAGATLEYIDGGKIVLMPSDVLKVVSTIASSLTVHVSALQQP